MDSFKGYVPTKDKKCLLPFKNKSSDELQSYTQVKNLSEFAGILADDTILIDIDDFEQSEIMMRIVEDLQLKCRVYKTTRGKRFLFSNKNESDYVVETNKIHTKLACGLEADIKLGIKNSYSILKYQEKERKILYDSEEYQIIPKFLVPIKSAVDFLNMEDGDGRNQMLFNYILTLQSNDFSVEEARETIQLINKYVMKESLSEDELNIILRDEAFQAPTFFKKGKFLFNKFASTFLPEAP